MNPETYRKESRFIGNYPKSDRPYLERAIEETGYDIAILIIPQTCVVARYPKTSLCIPEKNAAIMARFSSGFVN